MKTIVSVLKLYSPMALIAVALGFLATPAYADNVTAWGGGGTSDNWTDGANWIWGPGGAPANDGTRDVWVSWTGNTRTSQTVDTPYSVNSIFLPNTMPQPITLSGSALTVVGGAPTGGGEGAIGVQGGSLIVNNNVSISASTITLLAANNGSLTLNGAVTTGAGSVTTVRNYTWNTFSSSTLTLGATASFTGSELDVVSFTTGGWAGGTTLTLDNSSCLNSSITLKLSEASLGNASDSAKLNLNFSGTQTVGSFSINGVAQAGGTYGATGSGAANIDDIHFLGAGVLQVAGAAVVPSASFTGSPTNGMGWLTVIFKNTSTGTITNQHWNFGDSQSLDSTASILSHTYGPGTYTVTLTASGPLGSSTNEQINCITVGAASTNLLVYEAFTGASSTDIYGTAPDIGIGVWGGSSGAALLTGDGRVAVPGGWSYEIADVPSYAAGANIEFSADLSVGNDSSAFAVLEFNTYSDFWHHAAMCQIYGNGIFRVFTNGWNADPVISGVASLWVSASSGAPAASEMNNVRISWDAVNHQFAVHINGILEGTSLPVTDLPVVTNVCFASGGATGYAFDNFALEALAPATVVAPTITSVVKSGNDIDVTWTAVGGKTYALQSAVGIGGTNVFTDLSGLILAAGSGNTTTNYVDVGAVTSAQSRYYRVRMAP